MEPAFYRCVDFVKIFNGDLKMKLVLGILIAASSVFAQGYYGYQSYYGYPYGYSYDNWSWPDDWQNPYNKPVTPSVPSVDIQQPVDKNNEPMNKPYEQQFSKLVIMFTKDNCPYCQYMKPIMQQAEQKFGQDVKFLYIDIVRNEEVVSQYGIEFVPHIMHFKDGKQVDVYDSGNKSRTLEDVTRRIRNSFFSSTIAE